MITGLGALLLGFIYLLGMLVLARLGWRALRRRRRS